MNNTLSYKGLTAKIEFSADDNVFVGRVLGIDEIVVFHGSTVEELKSEMREMIDFYLETCEKKGKKPEKAYSGKILFRFPPELHAAIAKRAEILGKSINEYGREAFEQAVQADMPNETVQFINWRTLIKDKFESYKLDKEIAGKLFHSSSSGEGAYFLVFDASFACSSNELQDNIIKTLQELGKQKDEVEKSAT